MSVLAENVPAVRVEVQPFKQHLPFSITWCSLQIIINNKTMIEKHKSNGKVDQYTAKISMLHIQPLWTDSSFELWIYVSYTYCQNSRPWQLARLEKDRGSTLTIITHTSPDDSSRRWSFAPMFEDKARRQRIIGMFGEVKVDKVHSFLYPSPSFNLRGGHGT